MRNKRCHLRERMTGNPLYKRNLSNIWLKQRVRSNTEQHWKAFHKDRFCRQIASARHGAGQPFGSCWFHNKPSVWESPGPTQGYLPFPYNARCHILRFFRSVKNTVFCYVHFIQISTTAFSSLEIDKSSRKSLLTSGFTNTLFAL